MIRSLEYRTGFYCRKYLRPAKGQQCAGEGSLLGAGIPDEPQSQSETAQPEVWGREAAAAWISVRGSRRLVPGAWTDLRRFGGNLHG